MATLLQSVLRRLVSPAETGPDPDLLRRFADGGDPAAFAALVQRHGGLVWGVCRQMLPTEADAEDAFQATFLVLVRRPEHALRARAVGGWLHGVAVKVCLKSRRAAARRRRREERAAKGEAVLVGELAWDELNAAVHEEVGRLPADHRTAFVLCDLQGVRQTDAAAQLGWKIGTLTGRLARARQQLLKRLTVRGLAPAAGVGVVAAGGFAAAAPPALADNVLSLSDGGAIPSAVLTLTNSILEGTLMKVKLLAAAVLTAAGLALTAGGWLATADAQVGAGGAPPGAGGPGAQPPGAGGPARPPGAGGGGGAGGGVPGLGGLGTPGGPGMSGPGGIPGMPGGESIPSPKPRIEHALVDLPDTEKKLAELFNKRQAEGWEFAGQVGQSMPGGYLKLAFKRPTAVNPGTATIPGMGGPAGGGMGGDGMEGPAAPGLATPGASRPGPGGVPGTAGVGGPPPGGVARSLRGDGEAGGPPLRQAELVVYRLKHADAASIAKVIGRVYQGAVIEPDDRTNSVLVRAGKKDQDEIRALMAKLDEPVKDEIRPMK